MHYFNQNPDYVWRSIVLNYQRSSKFGLKVYKNVKIFFKKLWKLLKLSVLQVKLLSLKVDVSLLKSKFCLSQSVVARGLLNRIQDKSGYLPVYINFSAQTSSARTQEIIESKLEKKRKNILGNGLQLDTTKSFIYCSVENLRKNGSSTHPFIYLFMQLFSTILFLKSIYI